MASTHSSQTTGLLMLLLRHLQTIGLWSTFLYLLYLVHWILLWWWNWRCALITLFIDACVCGLIKYRYVGRSHLTPSIPMNHPPREEVHELQRIPSPSLNHSLLSPNKTDVERSQLLSNSPLSGVGPIGRSSSQQELADLAVDASEETEPANHHRELAESDLHRPSSQKVHPLTQQLDDIELPATSSSLANHTDSAPSTHFIVVQPISESSVTIQCESESRPADSLSRNGDLIEMQTLGSHASGDEDTLKHLSASYQPLPAPPASPSSSLSASTTPPPSSIHKFRTLFDLYLVGRIPYTSCLVIFETLWCTFWMFLLFQPNSVDDLSTIICDPKYDLSCEPVLDLHEFDWTESAPNGLRVFDVQHYLSSRGWFVFALIFFSLIGLAGGEVFFTFMWVKYKHHRLVTSKYAQVDGERDGRMRSFQQLDEERIEWELQCKMVQIGIRSGDSESSLKMVEAQIAQCVDSSFVASLFSPLFSCSLIFLTVLFGTVGIDGSSNFGLTLADLICRTLFIAPPQLLLMELIMAHMNTRTSPIKINPVKYYFSVSSTALLSLASVYFIFLLTLSFTDRTNQTLYPIIIFTLIIYLPFLRIMTIRTQRPSKQVN